MKTWVMADVVPERNRSWLTAGKWYELLHGDMIVDDSGDTISIYLECSAILDDEKWNVHRGDTPPDAKPAINEAAYWQMLVALEEILQYAEQYPGDMGFEDFAKTKAKAAIKAARGE